MKKSLLLVVTMCMVSLLASAQANPDEAALRQIEQDWVNAEVKADTAAMDRILAADFVFTDYVGQMSTKAQYLAELKSGATKAESSTINEMKPRIFGDVAIVHGMGTWRGTWKGKDASGQYRWTGVYQRRGGRWQAVATHVSKVAVP